MPEKNTLTFVKKLYLIQKKPDFSIASLLRQLGGGCGRDFNSFLNCFLFLLNNSEQPFRKHFASICITVL